VHSVRKIAAQLLYNFLYALMVFGLRQVSDDTLESRSPSVRQLELVNESIYFHVLESPNLPLIVQLIIQRALNSGVHCPHDMKSMLE
jgi:hypothetical protein